MIKALAFPFLCILATSTWATTFKLEEKDLPALIETRNGRIASSKAEIEASQTELGHLRRSFLPRLQLNVGYENTDGTPQSDVTNSYGYATALASVNVFNGGRDELLEKSRTAKVHRAQSELQNSKFTALTEARTLYWQILYQKEIITILDSALKLNETNLQSALKKIRNNLATKTDEIDFNQTKIQLTQDLQKAKIILANNMRGMAALLNHPLNTQYEVPELNVHEPEHTLDHFKEKEFTGDKHREIKILEAAKSSFDFESTLNSRWWTPQLDLYGAKTTRFHSLDRTNEMDRDQGEILGLKLTFFFDGFQTRATSVAQAYRTMSISHLREQRKLEIQSGYDNSYQLYVLNHDLVHSAEENNKIAQRYYENVWGEYMRGIKNSPDVLQAFQRIVEAKLRYADIKKDYQIARAEIMGYLEQ